MSALTWSKGVNEIRDAIYNILKNANLKNKDGTKVTLYKRSLPSEPSKNDCPIIAVLKRNAAGNKTTKDQPSLELPARVYFIIGVCDYSMIDLDEAEVKADDLIDKIFVVLEKNPSLNNLVSGIDVESVNWSETNTENIWFSAPSIELSMVGTDL